MEKARCYGRYRNVAKEIIGNKTCRDPYGYIDGTGPYLKCCFNRSVKYTALAVRLLKIQDIWNDEKYLVFADRWVQDGWHTRPDPCAPFDGNRNNYGKTYGPDGKSGCIKGKGRFPKRDRTEADYGMWGNHQFGNDMWKAFRKTAGPLPLRNSPRLPTAN